MHLSSLFLKDFRNYDTLAMRYSPGINIIYGQNAQGKTNLLESIYFLATGRSHRTSRDHELIREGAENLTARALVERLTGELSLELVLAHDKPKQVRINGLPERRIARLVGSMAAVLFSPDDLQLVKGPPSGRRRFLDIELSQISQLYLQHLMSYNKVLQQRNTALRSEKVDETLLSIYDQQLLELGSQLVARRARAVVRFAPVATTYHHRLSEGKETLRIEYQSQGAEPNQTPDIPEIQERLWAQFQHRRRDELRRQMTLVGPHRDDLAFLIDGRDARSFASQGQQRTTLLALKLAELQFMSDEIGEPPLLLLDDVASELDPQRRHYLLQAVEHGVQTFLTCTDLADLTTRKWPQQRCLFRVQSGQIAIEEG